MKRPTRKQVILFGSGVAMLSLLVFAFLPQPIPVETARVMRGPLQVTIDEEGETASAERFAITAPVAAFLQRVELEPGDWVERGQAVATLGPPAPPLVDPDVRAEALARVRAAEAAARVAAEERTRTERLAAGGSATEQALEQAVGEAERAAAEVGAAEAALRLLDGAGDPSSRRGLTAPAAGRVLRVARVSAGPVNPGDTLLVIGEADALEVRVDVLSEDAVRIPPGARVLIDEWGGEPPLEAVVRRVEPQGFTTISALGVEEQRVTVVAAPSDPELWTALGPGYGVVARFVIRDVPSVLQVPSSALFRLGDEWAVFVVEEGRARRRTVVIGQEAGLTTEVVSGLEADEEVIVYPSNEIADGVLVARGGA